MVVQEGFLEEDAFEVVSKGEALNTLKGGGICSRVSGKEGAMTT